MNIIRENKFIFDIKNCYLLHIISSDFEYINKKLDTEFDKRFNVTNQLIDQLGNNYSKLFEVSLLSGLSFKTGIVINLLLTDYHYNTHISPIALIQSLHSLKATCISYRINKLAISACNVTNEYSNLITVMEDVFKDLDITLIVCTKPLRKLKPVIISKSSKAIQIIEDNYIMINSLLTKEELRSFKNNDFSNYLINLIKEHDKRSKN